MKISNQIETFEAELRRRKYRDTTVEHYVSCATGFLAHFKDRDSVKHISEQDIKDFLGKFTGNNTQRAYHSASLRN